MGNLAGAVFGGIFVAATSAGTWAAYSYSYESALSGAAATTEQSAPPVQLSNATSKGDRLTVPGEPKAVAVEAIIPQATMRLTSTTPQIAPAPQAEAATTGYTVAAYASTPAETPKPRIDMRKPAAPATAEKPKRAEAQKPLLDDAQIAALKTRLRLTPAQEEFWPAVEVTLRDVVRSHARKSRNARVAPQIDVNSAEVQQLVSAAVPLIMRLSEEQKREVRQLARIIGLETVAQRI